MPGRADLIVEVHQRSRGTDGARRVHAELRLGHGIMVGHNAVSLLMRHAGLAGITGRPKWRHAKPDRVAADLVARNFARTGPNQLWLTDSTEHLTREGKVFCAVVLDTFLPLGGWLVDRCLANGGAGDQRARHGHRPPHPTQWRDHPSDQGVQFASWGFTQRVRDAGLLPSMGSVGDCYDNAMMEAFWSRMQVELLDRHRWRTRVELANAIFEYLGGLPQPATAPQQPWHADPARVRAGVHRGMRIQPRGSAKPGAHPPVHRAGATPSPLQDKVRSVPHR
jgi:putative transposase